ncbi:globin family protein [Aestuariispira insulae]|uniref:Nitric oxide dioxygenase n=1 Tax=Aestuariispira insulae TaxID=1461337 RepID=A0A3D9HPZ6_9PROT|nr:globin family protein [Aestuariispira insulae]RED51381.1 nitric oxide dioxygenase [Aestuariispira insulae]
MTPKQIDLVQTTFKDVAAIKEQAAALFYDRLFEIDPGTRALFKGDMKEQGRKLMATIGVAVASLRNLEAVLPTVRKLAEKHVDYGVQESHYQTVGAALLWTLEKGLGSKFTPEVKEAWTAVYGALAGVMIDAAREKPMKDELLLLFARAFAQRNDFA